MRLHLSDAAFVPNPAPDFERYRVAFERAILASLFTGTLVALLFFISNGQTFRIALSLQFALIGYVAWRLQRQGRTRLGYRVVIFGVWAASLAGIALINGVQAPGVSVLIPVILLAGWLVRPRAALLLAACTVVALFVLAYAAEHHALLPVTLGAGAYYAAIVHSLTVAVSGALGYFGARAVNAQMRALDNSRACLSAALNELRVREEDLQRSRAELCALNQSLERHVAERTVALQAAVEQLEGFSYSVAHDLNAPLRAISGFASILLEEEGAQLSEDGRRQLRTMAQSAVHMGHLVEGFLTLAQISREELHPSTLDFAALAREAARGFEGSYPQVELRIGEALPAQRGDARMVRQLLENLLGNAYKFSSKQPAPLVELGWDAGRRAWFVRDNGVGFDAQFSNRAFGMFERLHSREEYDSPGLGLALVKRIVERHHGYIWAESKPGEGAAFFFSFDV
ncbi:MAG TPA: ATP-binding protein [Burkholderiales bacterium]|nr:ATP-binding protein [Burkholderiales bacterium]